MICEGDRARVGVSHGMVKVKLLCFRWLSPFLKLVAVASMWVVTLHNLFLYSEPPLPYHPPSYWLRLFSNQTFSCILTPTFSNLLILHNYPAMKMEQSVPKRRYIKFRRPRITQKKAYDIQNKAKVWNQENYYYSLRNNPEERNSDLLRGGSLKSWTSINFFICVLSDNLSRKL
jgi:hypothetical protein